MIESDAFPHGLYPIAVNVRVTAPLVISVDPGVYIGLLIVGSLKVPSPLVVHITDESFVAVPPTTCVVSEQIVASRPAYAVGV